MTSCSPGKVHDVSIRKIARKAKACSAGEPPALGWLNSAEDDQLVVRRWLVQRIAERAIEIMQDEESRTE